VEDDHGRRKRRGQNADELLKGKKPEEILGQGGLARELTKRLVERALQGEMTAHLGEEKHAREGRNSGNPRNGTAPKTVLDESGEMTIEVPRDRNGDFEPQIVPKGRRRLPGFDDKMIALYACGMRTREIQSGLSEIYGTEVSPEPLGAGDPVLRLPAGDPEDHLHDERDRVDQLFDPEGGEQAGGISDGGFGAEGALPGHHEGVGALAAAGQGLVGGAGPLRDRVRGASAEMIRKAVYTEGFTPPALF
jgi:hypothetical protein